MSKAKIKKMFPGAVTSRGFYSNYSYIIDQDALHIFVIKGGPGVGKSTFMKKIGDSMLKLGYDIEYHCCSSDNNSIDGLVIPSLGVALLDGTAPHVVDPKNPGAVDEIINLGEYWNEALLKKSRTDIKKCNYQVGRYFQAAYYALQEAQTALDEWQFYVSEHQNWEAINQMMLQVEREILKSTPGGYGKQRHLFAWAHTPQGKCQFIDTLLPGISVLYTLQGQPGTGKSTFIARLGERALANGFDVEFYHNTLDPSQLDLIIIPGLQSAMSIVSEPYAYTPQFSGKQIILDFNQSLNIVELEKVESDIQDCRIRVNQNIERAIKNSLQAKKTHDYMETFYVAAMDFSAIEKKRLEIEGRILSMAEMAIAVSSRSKLQSQ